MKQYTLTALIVVCAMMLAACGPATAPASDGNAPAPQAAAGGTTLASTRHATKP